MGEPKTDRCIAVFGGTVTCTSEAGASPGLTLHGVSAEDPQEELMLSFIDANGVQPPSTLEAVRVVALDAQCYRIESPPRHWSIRARALYLHRDARKAFFRAIPPRPAPLGKRVFWRTVLWLAGRRSVVSVLGALRRR